MRRDKVQISQAKFNNKSVGKWVARIFNIATIATSTINEDELPKHKNNKVKYRKENS